MVKLSDIVEREALGEQNLRTNDIEKKLTEGLETIDCSFPPHRTCIAEKNCRFLEKRLKNSIPDYLSVNHGRPFRNIHRDEGEKEIFPLSYPGDDFDEEERELLEKWFMHVLVKIEREHGNEAPPPWRGLIRE